MLKIQLIKVIVGLICGLLFGSGMIISEMVDPDKVIGFLNVTGEWDPTLIFVLGGALIVFTPIYHLFIKNRDKAIDGEPLSLSINKSIDNTLISGSVIFGIGWGLAGFCPGPVVSSLGGGSYIILAFMLSMVIGMLCANQYMGRRRRLSAVGK
tara:strand:- start:3780 stop:4238 length:459 start_codon:yes stop_codon:yes gene_type:complete